MDDICQDCISRLQSITPLGLSESWADPVEFLVTIADLYSSASNGCKLCDRHLQKHIAKGLPTKLPAKGSFEFAGDDLSGELVVSLQFFAEESDELSDMVRLTVDGTPLELYTTHNDPAAQYISAREVKAPKNSTLTIDQVQKWIGDCQTGHGRKSSRCDKFIDAYLPNRCIDVFPNGETERVSKTSVSNPKLVETRGEKGKYIALSYCWGKDCYNPLRTTERSYESFLEEIPFHSLALTLQDAIRTTQQLGVRYIWIDALCIIQDSRSDKDAQIGQMRSIFENAFLTILAAGAANASQGFLGMPEPKICEFRIPYFCPNGEIGRLYCREEDQLDIKDQPINRRAWTLEERLLSHRKVFYLKDHVAWECDGISLHDSGHILNMHEDDLRLPNDIREGKTVSSPEWLQWTVHTEWVKNVAWYTKRELTRPNDKLRAVGGIAEKYQVVMNDRYLAGLWRKHIPAGLLWRRIVASKDDILLPRPLEDRAPSWSWASIDGEIEYDWPERKEGSVECSRLGHKESIASLVEIEVTDADIELAVPDKPFGAVRNGFIKASGMMRVVRGVFRPGQHDEKGKILQIDVQEYSCGISNPQIIDCWPDSAMALPRANDELWLLVLTGAAESTAPHRNSSCIKFAIRGLILTSESTSTFRRVGFFELQNSDYEVLMSGFEKQTIILL